MAITLDGNNASTVGVINSATAKASTSGTSIDFTGIPSGVKRITVMFNGVSTNGTSVVLLQVGSGSVLTSGYLGAVTQNTGPNNVSGANFSTGFRVDDIANAAGTRFGHAVFTLISGNTWVFSSVMGRSDGTSSNTGGGAIVLSGSLDRVRITTVNGTDTFDAGSINILYE